MRRTVGCRAVVAASVLLFAATAWGQAVGDSTGTIEGVVTDRTAGRAVSGVDVCASGTALIAQRSCVSSGPDGSYRIQALPPGKYVLDFALPGFTPARIDGVQVALGATTSVPVMFDILHQRQAITVEGSARAFDRQATTRSVSFPASRLELLPGSRNMGAIVTATDSVLMARHDVGGSTAFGIGVFSAYGITGFNRPMLEGIDVSGLNSLGFSLDYGSFDEVSVGLGAYGPEWPTPSVNMQMLTKSGGNQYRGSAYFGVESERWQARNIDADQIAAGAAGGAGISATDANRLDSYHDLNADVGGFLRKDHFWLYASFRDQRVAAWRVTFPETPIETRAWTGSGKLTARMGNAQRVILFVNRSLSQQPILLGGFLLSGATASQSEGSTADQRAEGLVWKAEWNGDVRGKFLVEARVGQFVASRGEYPNGDLNQPRIEDRVTFKVTGENREWQEERRHDQVAGSFSFGLGTHLLKVGGEAMRREEAETWTRSYSGDVLHELDAGRRFVYLFQTPSRSESGQWWYSVFANDMWSATNTLTISLGLRFDRFRVFLPAQVHPEGRFTPTPSYFPAVDNLIDWNVVAPRIGASQTLGANHRTVLKFSYGLYWLPPGTELGFNTNPNARTWYSRHDWIDANRNGEWEPGEEGIERERRGGVQDILDPNLKLPYVNEVTARVEHEARGGVALQTGIVLRGVRQQGARQLARWPYEVFTERKTIPDPGPDGQRGTDDDGPDVTVYEVPSSLAGSPSAQTGIVGNVPHADSDYVTWEATVDRRISSRWSLTGSFATTWNRDQASGYLGQTVRNNALPLTPNDFIHTDARGRHVFTVWTAKVFGTYEAPLQFRITPFVHHQSGQPFARTIQQQLNVGSVRVLTEPVGTRRQDHVTLLDLRVERAFRIRDSRLSGFLEVFNALNANPEQNVNWSTSTNGFLRPLAIVPPRIVRLGLKYDW